MHKQLTELLPGIYEIRLYQGTNEIHLFLITGNNTQRHLLVDTGYNTPENRDILDEILKELHIEYSNLDIFLTHKHHDHTGMASHLAGLGARIYMNPVEDRHPYDCLYYSHGTKTIEEQAKVLNRVGVTETRTPALYKSFQEFNAYCQNIAANDNSKFVEFPYTAIGCGNKFSYGDYEFHAISLPGHTLGQLGLYEPAKHIVLSGDHLIKGLAPIVGTSYTNEHLLEQYFRSLDLFKTVYRTCTVYPAHGQSFANPSLVAADITAAYRKKLLEIQHVLMNSAKALTVQEVAFRVYGVYNIPTEANSFFKIKSILSKTFTCLEYLYDQKYCDRMERDGMLFYR